MYNFRRIKLHLRSFGRISFFFFFFPSPPPPPTPFTLLILGPFTFLWATYQTYLRNSCRGNVDIFQRLAKYKKGFVFIPLIMYFHQSRVFDVTYHVTTFNNIVANLNDISQYFELFLTSFIIIPDSTLIICVLSSVNIYIYIYIIYEKFRKPRNTFNIRFKIIFLVVYFKLIF